MKKLIIALTMVAGLSVVAANDTNNTLDSEQWTLSLAGQGATTTKSDSRTAFGAEISVGHVADIILPGEIGFRQNFARTENLTFGTTKLYSDWTVLNVKPVEFLIGGNAGVAYGDSSPIWTISPELVTKVHIKRDVWLFGRLEYPFDIDENATKNLLTYTIGVGVKF